MRKLIWFIPFLLTAFSIQAGEIKFTKAQTPLTSDITYNDDVNLKFGTDGDVSFKWFSNTTNDEFLDVGFIESNGQTLPGIVVHDASYTGGSEFNNLTDTFLALVDDGGTHYGIMKVTSSTIGFGFDSIANPLTLSISTAGVVINDASGSTFDFRAESDNFANALFVDASTDSVGIFSSSPTQSVSVDIDHLSTTGINANMGSAWVEPWTGTILSGGTTAALYNVQFLAPTFNGVAGGGTETVTQMANIYIDNAPVTGTDLTVTNPSYALWVDDGITRFDGDIDLGSAGVKVTNDGDGAITFLGLGNGFDEDLTLNLDDTSNSAVLSSSTGVSQLDFVSVNLGISDNGWLGLGSAAGLIEFDDQATDEVNILNANVGIGTSTPGALLELYKLNATEGAELKITSKDTAVGSPPFSLIEFETSRTDSTDLLQAGRIISGWDGNSYSSSRITIQNVTAADTWVDALTFKLGRVGIGTATPLEEIHLDSTGTNDVTFRMETTTPGDPIIEFYEDSTSRGYLRYDVSASDLLLSNVSVGTNSDLVLRTSDANKLTVKGSGRINIDASSGAETSIYYASTTVASAAGPSITASSLIPAGSLVLGVTSYITTAFGVTNGLTSISIGDGSDVDRWGNAEAITLGADTDMTDFTGTQPAFFAAANNVVITGNGDGADEFDATGTVRITVHYITLTAPTS